MKTRYKIIAASMLVGLVVWIVDAALKAGAGSLLRKPLTLKSLAVSVRQELDRET